MSGKFRKCSVIVALSFCFTAGLFAAGGANLPPKPEFQVNGFRLLTADKNQIIGLRFKGMGDWLMHKKAYSTAIKYYENATQYLPNEADIFFNLGEIYFREGVYNLAEKYYKIATAKYMLPENAGKTKERYYMSLIMRAISLKLKGDVMEAEQMTMDIDKLEMEIQSKYPGAYTKLKLLYNEVWGKYGKEAKF